MRILYLPASDKFWLDYYSGQARQIGYGFVGLPYQRGAGLGSLFAGLFRAILPLAKSAAKSVGREALATGADMASDILQGESIKRTVKRRGRKAASQLLKKASKKIAQTGGKRRKRRSVKTIRRKKPKTKRQKGRGLGKRPIGRNATSGKRVVKRRKIASKKVDTFGTYYG